MITLELEADKVRLARAILNIDDASVMAEVKKYLSGVLNLNANIAKSKPRRARAISKEVQEMVIGELPVGMDSEKETDKMWEELAK